MNSSNYYQYQPPIAMFSMAQFDRLDRADFGIVNAIKEPFRRYGRTMADRLDEKVKQAADDFVQRAPTMNAQEQAAEAARILNDKKWADWARANPGKAGAIGYGTDVAVGATIGGVAVGAHRIFTRRRRTKKGKIVVEQVRR